MEDMALVSVIIPVYNEESYLRRCLDSVVNQTYRNLEIILVDDGSTDGSAQICTQFMEKDSRIRLYRQENQGQSAARNFALEHMSGQYFTFVDADDYISLSYVEIMLEKLLEYRVHLAVCGRDRMQEDRAGEAAVYPGREIPVRRMERDEVYDQLPKDSTFSGLFMVAGKLYDRAVFYDFRFPGGKVHEDEFTVHKIYGRVGEICYIELPLYHYVLTHNSTVRRDGVNWIHPEAIEAFLERLEYFQSYGKPEYIRYTVKAIVQCTKQLHEQSGWEDREAQRIMRDVMEEVRRITGRRFFSAKYFFYCLSPKAYRFLRSIYRRLIRPFKKTDAPPL